MKRILTIEPNWLGDVLFTTPAISAIRQHCKNVYIAVIVHKRCAPVLKNNPNIDEIIIFESGRGLKGFFERLSLIHRLKSSMFNTAFLFSRSMSNAVMCKLAGIPKITGYFSTKKALFLTHKVMPQREKTHRVEHFLDITRSVGIDTDNKDYEFFINNDDAVEADIILSKNNISKNEPYFVINPGGNWLPKRWPKENFAKLADELFNKYNIKAIITGAEKDISLGEDIKKMCKQRPINLCGKTTLGQLAVILKEAKAVIANDTGPMHIAVSQKAPTVALFGPTDPKITGPYGNSKYIIVEKKIDCPVPCYNKNCRKNRCMEAISVADVMEAMDALEHYSRN